MLTRRRLCRCCGGVCETRGGRQRNWTMRCNSGCQDVLADGPPFERIDAALFDDLSTAS